MGVRGASLATMLSQFVSCALLLVGCTRPGNIRIDLKTFSPTFYYIKEITRGGFPSLCRQGLGSVATICINHASGGFGDEAIAAMSIVQRVIMFANSALLGFGQGFQPVCGFNYGARLYRRVRQAFWFCVRYSFAVMLLLSVCGYIFAPDIIAIFRRDDPEVIRIGALALRLQCIPFSLMGWVILNNMMMQTIGKAGRATILALARQGLFLLPCLFILTWAFGLLGIQMSQAMSDFATFFLSIPLSMSVLREMKED
jgi:Na+-driven multidrug efflux pump